MKDSATVLVVDDETVVRVLISRTLQLKGYNVLQAEAAEEALKIWAEYSDRIDLLITDLTLPGEMSGLELAACLKQQDEGLRIIYISGYMENVNDFIAELDARDTFLQKPFTFEILSSVVRQVLDSPGPAQSPGSA